MKHAMCHILEQATSDRTRVACRVVCSRERVGLARSCNSCALVFPCALSAGGGQARPSFCDTLATLTNQLGLWRAFAYTCPMSGSRLIASCFPSFDRPRTRFGSIALLCFGSLVVGCGNKNDSDDTTDGTLAPSPTSSDTGASPGGPSTGPAATTPAGNSTPAPATTPKPTPPTPGNMPTPNAGSGGGGGGPSNPGPGAGGNSSGGGPNTTPTTPVSTPAAGGAGGSAPVSMPSTTAAGGAETGGGPGGPEAMGGAGEPETGGAGPSEMMPSGELQLTVADLDAHDNEACSKDSCDPCVVIPLDSVSFCDNANTAPAMSWTAGAEAPMSYAIFLVDTSIDATHWGIWNIPGDVTSLPAALPAGALTGDLEGASQNSGFGSTMGYYGPGACDHVYEFRLYAVTEALTATALAAVKTELDSKDFKTSFVRVRSECPDGCAQAFPGNDCTP